VVVVSEDAVYVGRLSDAQDVGRVVKELAKDKATAKLTEEHRTSYRPWGGYSSILVGERFQVKRLFVKPGKQLSLQKSKPAPISARMTSSASRIRSVGVDVLIVRRVLT
jgi:mannose-1-phosphate guanylyltransferase